MNKEIKLAYLAGALDGDGSFSLIKGLSSAAISPLYYPMIQISNVEKEIIDLFDDFNGNRNLRKSYVGKDGGTRKPSHQWKLEKSTKCLPFLEVIITYLIVKKQRAEFLRDYIIDNPFIRGSRRLDKQTLINRERSYLKMRSFNDNPHTSCELLPISKRGIVNSDLFWSYVAGLMDTDGSFSFKKEIRSSGGSKSPVYTATILLSMVDCRAIYYIMNNFIGGNAMVIKSSSSTNGFCYRFSITSRKVAKIFLANIIPFIKIKKDIAKKLLDACDSFKVSNGRKGVSLEELAIRDKYYSDIVRLNKYGVYKSSLMDLKLLPGDAEDNKAQAVKTGSVNVASGKTSDEEDAVL